MNNFDVSTTGLNVELDCFRDTDLARFWFEDSFACVSRDSFSLLNTGYRGVSIFAYQLPDFDLFDLRNWIVPTKVKLHDLMLNKLFNGCTGTFNTEAKDQYGKLSYKLTKPELLEFLSNTYEPDYHEFIVRNFEPKFKVVSSRGYCQGDYAEVIYMPDELGTAEELNFDNELWSTPIYCRLTINDEEFYIDSEMKDQYEYDEDEIASIIIKLIRGSEIEDTELAISEALALIPSEPAYQ